MCGSESKDSPSRLCQGEEMWKSFRVAQAAAHLPRAQHTRGIWLAEPGQASEQCWSWAGSKGRCAGVRERQSMAGQGLCFGLAVE